MTEQERHDQQKFDETVARGGKVVLQALAGIGVLAAFLMAMVALVQSGEKDQPRVAAATAAPKPAAASKPAAAAAAGTLATKTINLKIVPEYKKGPDGQKHDVFTVTDFQVKVGQPLKLRIDNADSAPHSINSPVAGVNIVIQPGRHTYSLVVDKAGKFQWNCMLPCDDWAMQNVGYMAGYIIAT